MASVKIAQKNKTFCWDCKKEIKIEGQEVKNGKILVYENGEEELKVFRCNDCFEKSPELRNFQSCEVYSRVVGYLRPVQQWNDGKQREYKERKEYSAPK